MGRIVTTADLISLTDGADSSVVPTLHDVNAINLESGKMRIGGFEIVAGAHYGQVWDLKVAMLKVSLRWRGLRKRRVSGICRARRGFRWRRFFGDGGGVGVGPSMPMRHR